MQMLEDAIEAVYECISLTMLFIPSSNAFAYVLIHPQYNATVLVSPFL
jgi:hypothetical protein